jgi:plastocyanin
MSAHLRVILWLTCTVLVIIACLAAGCTSGPAPAVPAPAPPTAAGGNTISIKNFAFDPSALTMKTGTPVTWVNNDSSPHTITSDQGSLMAFSSDSLASGASYTVTFTQAGTFTYHCAIHPSMTGTIIVE